jgi:apolipoprotein N-acyltransferase
VKTDIRMTAIAVAGGLMLTAAFPKIDLDGLAWAALVPLLWVLVDVRPGEAFRRGLIFGGAHFLSLLYWLVPTMVIYGHLPVYLAVAVLFLFAAILSLVFIAPLACGFSLAGRTPLLALITFPVFWVGFEYLRSFLFTGFPWELLGYSQYRRLHLIQISDIFGVYGLSGLLAFANAALFMGSLAITGKSWRERPVGRRFASVAVAAAAALAGLTWGYGAHRIAEIDRQAAAAPKSRLAVIQGNIEQSQKWDPAFQRATLETYLRLSLSTKPLNPDLIVWPESAAPFYFLAEIPPTQFLLRGLAETGTHALIGAPSFERRAEATDYYNSAYLVAPGGTVLGKYDKAHLVPYGEYTPYKEYLPFIGKMVEHVGDFVAGQEGKTLNMQGVRLGIQICYEIIFPSLSRAMVRNGAALLITITNDAWYGTTAGPYQHFSLAVLRAVENRRALARAANTGISGFVDPAGRVLAPTRLMEEAVVVQELPLLDTKSLYTRWGDVFAAMCLAGSAVFAAWGARRRRQDPAGHSA